VFGGLVVVIQGHDVLLRKVLLDGELEVHVRDQNAFIHVAQLRHADLLEVLLQVGPLGARIVERERLRAGLALVVHGLRELIQLVQPLLVLVGHLCNLEVTPVLLRVGRVQLLDIVLHYGVVGVETHLVLHVQ